MATDCLSEGINLQSYFNASIHYDLPWNPNRLEQREGRVDRFGQTLSTVVKTIRYFSPDNPIDGVVIGVLLDKAREIHRVLGTHVPVPAESETVTQAVLSALFFRGRNVEADSRQLELGLQLPEVKDLHHRWDLDAARERENRTRFAQRALKPEEVRAELEATDAVLGDPDAVRSFVMNAAQRLGLTLVADRKENVFRVAVGEQARANLPLLVGSVLPKPKSGQWLISFISPTPEGAEYLGRNHRFVSTLAQFLVEEAITKGADARASRCGVIRTRAVTKLTSLYLMRLRFLIEQPGRTPQLAEEVQVVGHVGLADKPEWLSETDVLGLLENARADANISTAERRELVDAAFKAWPQLDSAIQKQVGQRAQGLLESHRRIRQAVTMRVRGLSVVPQMPPDLLGLLVLQPLIGSS